MVTAGRVSTGIPGLDDLCQGGLVRGSSTLVTGGPGTGKTVFALQYAYRHAMAGKKVLFVAFEESVEGLKGDALSFGWDFDKLGAQCIFESFRDIGEQDIKSSIAMTVQRHDISIVVVDSISVLTLAFGDKYRMRRELYAILDTLREHGCTTVMTAELAGEASIKPASAAGLSSDGVSEYITDGIITLHSDIGDGHRGIRILKMRRTNHPTNAMPMSITAKGIVLGKTKKT